MTIVATDIPLEGLGFMMEDGTLDGETCYTCGPFDRMHRIDLPEMSTRVVKTLLECGEPFVYYVGKYGTASQVALAARYLRHGRAILIADMHHDELTGETPVSKIDLSSRPRDRGVLPFGSMREDIAYVFSDTNGDAESRDSDILELLGSPWVGIGPSWLVRPEEVDVGELVHRVGPAVQLIMEYRREDVEPLLTASEPVSHIHNAVCPTPALPQRILRPGDPLPHQDAVVWGFAAVTVRAFHSMATPMCLSPFVDELGRRIGHERTHGDGDIILIVLEN